MLINTCLYTSIYPMKRNKLYKQAHKWKTSYQNDLRSYYTKDTRQNKKHYNHTVEIQHCMGSTGSFCEAEPWENFFPNR